LSGNISDKDPRQLREFADTHPTEFFRDVVEPLADAFDAVPAAEYEQIMRAWIPEVPRTTPAIPAFVETVYVLSRVTLGADIKIVSPILAAMKLRFPHARIVFVANRKSAELFEADPRIDHVLAEYPRQGSVSARVDFAHDLSSRLHDPGAIVIDPDSRMTQLGLIPLGAPERYFHFPSRTAGGEGPANLSELIESWLVKTFGVAAPAYIAPRPEVMLRRGRSVAVSLGVGENDAKRIGGDFETRLIETLALQYETIWLDRGAGGEEARRVTAAVKQAADHAAIKQAANRAADRVHFWEGGFAGFASIVSQSDLYVGYDSAGQHAAAASGVPLISIFAGAPSERFRLRWSPAGHTRIVRIVTDGVPADAVLHEVARACR
jgi:ADP-heptose:LPS heptosyltransferase